jgi:uncharacterized Zn-finger protein
MLTKGSFNVFANAIMEISFRQTVSFRPLLKSEIYDFKCIGAKPPQDHPHIYLNMGDASEIVFPYCSTLFRFDPSLGRT